MLKPLWMLNIYLEFFFFKWSKKASITVLHSWWVQVVSIKNALSIFFFFFETFCTLQDKVKIIKPKHFLWSQSFVFQRKYGVVTRGGTTRWLSGTASNSFGVLKKIWWVSYHSNTFIIDVAIAILLTNAILQLLQ